MPWQIIFLISLILSTAASLLYRKLAVTSKLNPLISDTVRNITVSVPAAAGIVVISGDFQMPSTAVLAVSLFEAILSVAYGYVSFYAIKETDAATFTTLAKLSVVPVVAMSSLLLRECFVRTF